MKPRLLGRMGALLVLLGASLFMAAMAAVTQDREQVVYWPLVTDGGEYRRVAYPEEAGPILVLADTEVVIDPRRAPVSFWPITREYLADMARSTRVADVELLLLDTSGAARTFEPDQYVVWYPEGVGASLAELVRGEAALTLYNDYVAKARASAAEMQAYQR